MVDVVARGGIRLLDLVPRAVLAHDGVNLFLRPRQAHRIYPEILQVVFQDVRRVAPRVNADEDGDRAPPFVAEKLIDLGKFRERRRAGVRAGGVAEEEKRDLAAQLRQAEGPPVLVGQGEVRGGTPASPSVGGAGFYLSARPGIRRTRRDDDRQRECEAERV